jgi:hypothetical protein
MVSPVDPPRSAADRRPQMTNGTQQPLDLVERDLRATHYARCLEKVSATLQITVMGLEDEGDRVYLGSTNHADALREAWHYLDDLEMDELIADTQPATDLVRTNLELQDAITRLTAERDALRGALKEVGAIACFPGDGMICIQQSLDEIGRIVDHATLKESGHDG